MSTESRNVHQRLAAAMAEVDYIQKEQKKGMNYTIVSHDAVTAKVRPVLLKNGIVYYPVRCEHIHNGNRAECAMTVRFVNIDEPADFFDVPTFGYGIDPQDKGPGKAMSYAVKYALLKALGLETGDDPDTESNEFSRKDAHQPPPPPATETQSKPPSSAAEQKRALQDIEADMLDCATIAAVDKCADGWKHIARRDGWSKDYMTEAAKKFQARRDAIRAAEAEDVFPGDQPSVSASRVHQPLNA